MNQCQKGVLENQIQAIGEVLKDDNRPLKERFRALFTLKNIGGPVSIECISKCFDDPSALLKHELAYCLGQMQDIGANPVLISVLENPHQDPMVRHEAAEALGAIGTAEGLKILTKHLNDPVVEVAETCELAIKRIQWLRSFEEKEKLPKNLYNSIDPAPPALETNVDQLKALLLNENAPLFERYRAMFSLRNLKTRDAVLALGKALRCGSSLFRHEIAFVLGQLQDKDGVPYLKQSLEDTSENEMVRHECAEALGAVASDECFDILKRYLNDNKRVVKESCEIALDMCEYENSPKFQYANALQVIR